MMRLPTNEEVLYEAVGYEIGNLFQLVDDMMDKKIARDEDLIRGLVENLATNRLIKNNLDLKNLVHFIASQIEA
jgi:geranylgeranyl pyrophosphate synthase